MEVARNYHNPLLLPCQIVLVLPCNFDLLLHVLEQVLLLHCLQLEVHYVLVEIKANLYQFIVLWLLSDYRLVSILNLNVILNYFLSQFHLLSYLHFLLCEVHPEFLDKERRLVYHVLVLSEKIINFNDGVHVKDFDLAGSLDCISLVEYLHL